MLVVVKAHRLGRYGGLNGVLRERQGHLLNHGGASFERMSHSGTQSVHRRRASTRIRQCRSAQLGWAWREEQQIDRPDRDRWRLLNRVANYHPGFVEPCGYLNALRIESSPIFRACAFWRASLHSYRLQGPA